MTLAPYTTLKIGGPADRLIETFDADRLAEEAALAQTLGEPFTVLGWGSNVLPSDRGVAGTVAINGARRVVWNDDGSLIADSGIGMQDLFLQCVQRGRGGLSFAVGIPGTLGGALVSNAGAYRNQIGSFVTEVEVVEGGRRRWEPATWMNFSYRDSRLRGATKSDAVLTRIALKLPRGEARTDYEAARDYQRQRISKQPPMASAGSFFKNVVSPDLAQTIEGLTPGMRDAGVVPAGFLIESVGLKGHRLGGAMLGARHANFMLNVGNASAHDVRSLAMIAQRAVYERFGVTLQEEVLYLGRWDDWDATETSRFSP